MDRITKDLIEIRDQLVLDLYAREYSAEDIGKIFNKSTSQIYKIIKENKEKYARNNG